MQPGPRGRLTRKPTAFRNAMFQGFHLVAGDERTDDSRDVVCSRASVRVELFKIVGGNKFGETSACPWPPEVPIADGATVVRVCFSITIFDELRFSSL